MKSYKRIVAKFGTGLLTSGTERLDTDMISTLAEQIAKLRSGGHEVIVVTSGAIAAGRERLQVSHADQAAGRKDMPFRQVLASVGQSHLMQTYDSAFRKHDIVVAQTLLTKRDLSDRVAYLNARNTLLALLEVGALPIVNENDVVAVEEIADMRIGDNDNISALVANLVDADLLAILSDVKGLYTADPRQNADAELIPNVERVTPEIEALAGGTGSAHGVGGMVTKLQAAKLATAGGTDVVIAEGREQHVLERLASGEAIGTLFRSTGDRMESRKRWMLSGLAARGKIVVDGGAAKALRSGGRSLLPAGVKEIEGPFERGDIVPVYDDEGHRIAVGITNYAHADATAIRGVRSDKIADVLGHEFGAELIHRNNLVVL
jgi:glutamate 5-kinase